MLPLCYADPTVCVQATLCVGERSKVLYSGVKGVSFGIFVTSSRTSEYFVCFNKV